MPPLNSYTIIVLSMALPNGPQTPSLKEQKEILSGAFSERDKYPVVERPTMPEIPPEIEQVEARAGAEITLPQPVTDGQGQVIVSPAAPQQVIVTLPLTEEEMKRALHLKVVDSLRWLAEWMKRLLKIAGGKFLYKI